MRKCNNPLIPWLFLAPALLILGVFVVYPILCGAALAFFDFNMLRYDSAGHLLSPKWVGLANFKRLAADPYLAVALKNSLLYVLLVPFLQAGSLLLAWLLRGETLKERLARTALYVPVVTSAVVVGITWKWILRSDGLLNQALGWFSFGLIEPVPWLTDSKLAIFSLMMVTAWQGLGYYLILYLAGLQAIPKELEEHASLEGASVGQILLKIVVPLLKPTMAVCTLLSVISALKVFTEVFIITGGGPQNSTITASYYIYMTAFENFDMGYASALALILAIIIGFASLIHYLLFKKDGWELN